MNRSIRMFWSILALAGLLLLAACGEEGTSNRGTNSGGAADCPTPVAGITEGTTDEGTTGGSADYGEDGGPAGDESSESADNGADYVYTDTYTMDENESGGTGSGIPDNEDAGAEGVTSDNMTGSDRSRSLEENTGDSGPGATGSPGEC